MANDRRQELRIVEVPERNWVLGHADDEFLVSGSDRELNFELIKLRFDKILLFRFRHETNLLLIHINPEIL